MVNKLIGTLILAFAVAGPAWAQTAGTQRRGNPTPEVQQPPPPKIEDRITVTGCLTRVGPPPADPNSFSDARFAVTDAKREERGIPGAGTSAAAKAATGNRFRLAGIDTSFAPFVGTRVEVSGEVVTPSEGTGTTLRVQFLQKIAARCQ
ncbi:MAG: hypothetical protein EXQ48_07015 [Acidobacteria bacterium]|nr:hypothetical protein [Acidobacteriota bacterium]